VSGVAHGIVAGVDGEVGAGWLGVGVAGDTGLDAAGLDDVAGDPGSVTSTIGFSSAPPDIVRSLEMMNSTLVPSVPERSALLLLQSHARPLLLEHNIPTDM
jgi:hypothetical protein